MEVDFAILYFGLTRSIRKTHTSQKQHIFDVLDQNHLTYKKFMHTWETKDDRQNVWFNDISEKIDYTEHKLLNLDYYKRDSEDEFLESLNMDDYFYQEIWNQKGDCKEGEWHYQLIQNYLCMNESRKRCFSMIHECVESGMKFKHIIFIRPDITITGNDLPIEKLLLTNNIDNVPNHSHWDGVNDQFHIMTYENACTFAKAIDYMKDYRESIGRLVPELFCQFMIEKCNMKLNEIHFNYDITRP
jgi:hypothetical protein